MATGEVTTVTRTIETEVEVVALTLEPDEAQFLRDLLGWVGGDPKDTRRKHADAILVGLEEAGIKYASIKDFEFSGGVYMRHTS